MEIICPKCDFSRTVPDEKVPATAEMATCPKCGVKFRFRNLGGQETQQQPAQQSPRPSQAPSPPPPDLGQPDVTPPGAPPSAAPEAPPLPYEEGPQPPLAGSDTSSRQNRGDVFSGLEAMGEGAPRQASGQGARRRPDAPYEAGREDSYQQDYEEEVPWERLDAYGFFPGLFTTVKRAMLQPQRLFSSMPLPRGLMRPLAFYVLLSTLSAMLQIAYQAVGLSVLTSMQGPEADMVGGAEMMGMGAASVFILLLYPIVFTVGLYLTAAVHHLFLMLFQAASAGFEGTFRALAYGSAPTVLTIVPVLGWVVASIWMLVVTFIGLKTIHRTSYARVLTAFCAMFFTFVLLIGFLAYLIHSMTAAMS